VPSTSGPASLKVQLMPTTSALPILMPSRKIDSTSFPSKTADSVPASAGAVSLVVPPSATVPVAGATSSVIELITTVWVGGSRSMFESIVN
jgi:hypothetical protein